MTAPTATPDLLPLLALQLHGTPRLADPQDGGTSRSLMSYRLVKRCGLVTIVTAILMLRPIEMCAQAASAPDQKQVTESPMFPARESSGTSWLPDTTPMFGVVKSRGPWELMFHGTLFGQFLYEPGDKHRTGGVANAQVSAVNWGAVMARRPLGRGRFGLRAMLSLEPWTVTDCGFINYLATGEMCEGDTIHDRQHPHDLFMELAVDYDAPIKGSLRGQVYAGFAGEPALGPAGFPHRLSAITNPIAPITHHWLDSSHVTFGLVTAGLYQERWKAEASVFNGREPDSRRANIDLARLDSYSGRLVFMPNERWVFQVSSGYLNEAEAEFPPQPPSDVRRSTASATYHRPAGDGSVWATTMAYGVLAGREIVPGDSFYAVTHAALVESLLTIGETHAWFGRLEFVGKPAHDLHAHEFPKDVFTVGKFQAGYVRYFSNWHGVIGLGGTISLSLLPPELAPRYQGRVAPGFGVFLHVRPPRHGHSHDSRSP
jgi:hypothetical protein